jgi:hypothetical protein
MESNYRLDPEQCPEEDQISARRQSLLDCTSGVRADNKRKRVVVLTLGSGDGSVAQIALDWADGQRLLPRLAYALRPDRDPRLPRYGTINWLNRHSVLRAEARAEHDLTRVSDSIKRQLPDVAEFIEEELKILSRLLALKGRTSPKPQKILDRIRRLVLTTVDATRGDT